MHLTDHEGTKLDVSKNRIASPVDGSGMRGTKGAADNFTGIDLSWRRLPDGDPAANGRHAVCSKCR